MLYAIAKKYLHIFKEEKKSSLPVWYLLKKSLNQSIYLFSWLIPIHNYTIGKMCEAFFFYKNDTHTKDML